MKAVFACVITTVVFSTPYGAALAADAIRIEPDASKSSRSGVSGHGGDESGLAFDQYFLHGLTWSEESDDPNWMRIHGARFHEGEWRLVSRELALPGGAMNPANRKQVWLQSEQTIAKNLRAPMRFVRAIRICTSEKRESRREKLKGIEVEAVRLTPQGELVEDGAVESARRPNCRTWERRVACNRGEVAIGLVLNSSDDAGRSFNGVALQCAPLKVLRQQASNPVRNAQRPKPGR